MKKRTEKPTEKEIVKIQTYIQKNLLVKETITDDKMRIIYNKVVEYMTKSTGDNEGEPTYTDYNDLSKLITIYTFKLHNLLRYDVENKYREPQLENTLSLINFLKFSKQ